MQAWNYTVPARSNEQTLNLTMTIPDLTNTLGRNKHITKMIWSLAGCRKAKYTLLLYGVAVGQEVEQVVYCLEGFWFNP